MEPLLNATRPSTIVEIGVGNGGNTRLLAAFARRTGARVHSIDPFPWVDPHALVAEYHPHLTFHVARSLRVLELVGAADVALIDGDHNWYTVFHELMALRSISRDRGKRPPLVILHDVGWPYGRRDAYTDPELPEVGRQPSTVGGVFPERERPIPGQGLNWNFDHADHEGGPRNGIRTAVEDYLAVTEEAARFSVDPFNWGVGVVVPNSMLDANPVCRLVMDGLENSDRLERRAADEKRRIDAILPPSDRFPSEHFPSDHSFDGRRT